MELLFQVMSRLRILIFFLFEQETINIFLLILILGWRMLLRSVFDQVLMIVNSLTAVFVVLRFIKLRVGRLVQHGAILHILVLCHQYRLLDLF